MTCCIHRINGRTLYGAPLTNALLCLIQKDELRPLGKQQQQQLQKEVSDKDSFCADLNHEDLYFPSVDLLTAQVHTFTLPPKLSFPLQVCRVAPTWLFDWYIFFSKNKTIISGSAVV